MVRLTTLLLSIFVSAATFGQGTTPIKNSDIENIGTRDINKGSINFMSLEKEIALGRELAAEVERNMKFVEDPVVNEYVNRLGQDLVMNSDAKVPFTFRVVQSDEVNAVALPGGFVFVNTGLIRAADSEAELASALAHSIAHVTARHGAEQASKGQLLNVATIPLIFLGGPSSITFAPGRERRDTGGSLVPITFLSFYRKAIGEADYLGVQYLYKAGYDATAAVTLLRKFKDPADLPPLYRTHPPALDRAETLQRSIALLPAQLNPKQATPEFAGIKARLNN